MKRGVERPGLESVQTTLPGRLGGSVLNGDSVISSVDLSR